MNDKISEKDKKDWEDFIYNGEKLPNKDIKKRNKLKTITKSLDLHGYTLNDANLAVEKFILDSFADGANKLIIVTGKGIHSDTKKDPYVSKDLSILKYSVPDFILKNKSLMTLINGIQEARIEDGGSGAFYIFLKKLKK